ncbi:hypothetical protein L195_g034438 [Trifolium pratense]|nr:hypothetical protein L195_g034356 [Trifolium pratense]PNX78460.1 hypothetical protein L195_g034438 [Trifolium pratense]
MKVHLSVMLLARKVARQQQLAAIKHSNRDWSGFWGCWNEDTIVETKNCRENAVSERRKNKIGTDGQWANQYSWIKVRSYWVLVIMLSNWPSEDVLAHYCLSHRDIFRSKKVIELGSGYGLAGFVIAAVTEASE